MKRCVLVSNIKAGKSIVLIGSIGGHMSDLYNVASHLDSNFRVSFVTFYRPGRAVDDNYVLMIDPGRSIIKLIINSFQSIFVFLKTTPAVVVSSGAGFSVPFSILCKLLGRRVMHFELACQIDEPSLTGKLLKCFGIECYGQSERLVDHGFKFLGNPLHSFAVEAKADQISESPDIFVSLGNAPQTIGRINVVLRNIRALYPKSRISGQFAETLIDKDLGVECYKFLARDTLLERFRSADLILVHGGIGTILEILSLGKPPLVFPRIPELNEHTDVTQQPLGEFVARMGLGTALGASFSPEDVRKAVKYCLANRVLRKSQARDPGEEMARVIKEYTS